MTDAQPAETGVLFPSVDGRRSTQTTSRAVFAEATRTVAPDLAREIESARDWHKDYVRRLADIEAVGAASAKNALLVATDGLQALHQQLVFARDGSEVQLADALRTTPPRWSFATGTLDGKAERETQLAIPYRGDVLAGGTLQRQLDEWVRRGIVEPSFATAIAEVDAHPEWLDARDLTVVLIGAAAEMGPLSALTRWGATVAAIDIRSPRVWTHILGTARAGSSLLTELPEIRAWIDTLDGPLVIGNYAYADGAAFVRVAAAADALIDDVSRQRSDTALSYLASPTDVFAVPIEIVEAARADTLTGRRGRRIAAPMRSLTGSRMFAPNYARIVDSEEGMRFGLADSVVPQQGPNYALAKRLQRWRAVVSRESFVTSANVAPATRTRSVTKNRVLAAAYSGSSSFGVEIFETATSNMLMAAMLIHDLRNPAALSRPENDVVHPLNLFADGAAHGGLWRLPWEPRSVLPLAAVEGLLRRR